MRKSIVFSLFLVAVAAVWVFMMTLLVRRSVSTQKVDDRIPVSLSEEGDTEWMSIYLSGNKIGHIVSLTTRTETGYQSVESSYMRFGLSGTDQNMKTFVRATSDSDYKLTSFSFEIRSKDQLLKAEGEVEGGLLRIEVQSGDELQNLSFPLPEDAYMPFSVGPLIKQRGLREGDSVSVTIFDPSVFQPGEMWIRHAGTQTVEHLGKNVEATHLTTSFLGAKMRMWVDADGKTFRQEGPMGLLIVEEPRDMAERFPHSERPVELLTLFSVQSDKELPDPRSLTHLRVELVGADLDSSRLSNNRQSVLSTSPFLVEVTTVVPEPGGQQGELPDPDPYLRPDALLQADHPKMVAAADSIVGGLADPRVKSQAIAQWVYEELEKTPTVSLPSALDVLKTRQGDCNEHAVLVAALSRAAGVPATIASGLVYMDGSFYYHAWNRVYVGEWIDMDATFGQDVADATHLMLAEGGIENQASMTNVIGGLQIRILEYR